MKKLFILMLLPLALTGCVNQYTMDYKCEDGILVYTFQHSDGIDTIKSSGIAKYRDSGKTVKCVVE